MYVQPPVLLDGRLVAPWWLRTRVSIPKHLVEGEPVRASVELLVQGMSIVSEVVPVNIGDKEYVVELERFYVEVEWPQTVKVTTMEQVYSDVTSLDIGTCVMYATIYAFAPAGARVCVNDVCEDTDRDNDGIVEVVYLARPGERVGVECSEPCTVRVWRTPCLTQLGGVLRVQLRDIDDNVLYEAEFPVQTLEAPDWRPQGVTIALPAPVTPGIPQYPWCDAQLGDVDVDEASITEESVAPRFTLTVYEVVDEEAVPPDSALVNNVVTGGFGFIYSRGAGYSIGYYLTGSGVNYDHGVTIDAEFVCKATTLPRKMLVIQGLLSFMPRLLVTMPHVVPCSSCMELDNLATLGTVRARQYVLDEVGSQEPQLREQSFTLEPLGGVYMPFSPSEARLMVNGEEVETTLVGARTPIGELIAVHTGTHAVLIRTYYPVIAVYENYEARPVWSAGGIEYAVVEATGTVELRITVREEDGAVILPPKIKLLKIRRFAYTGPISG